MDEYLTADEFKAKYGEIKLNSRGRLILPRQSKEKKQPKPKTMNSAEKYFAETYLTPRMNNWSFEGMSIILGDGKKYKPDFVEFAPEGRVFYEVKQQWADGSGGWGIRATMAKMQHAKMIVEPFGMKLVLATIKGSNKAGNKRIVIKEL